MIFPKFEIRQGEFAKLALNRSAARRSQVKGDFGIGISDFGFTKDAANSHFISEIRNPNSEIAKAPISRNFPSRTFHIQVILSEQVA
jgi:hypothetical protein